MSSDERTNDRPIHSIFSPKINAKSFLSFCVKQGKDIWVSGRFTPLLEYSFPPKITFAFIVFFMIL